ncbi:MAG: hypothetical protein EHM48_03535 [Planctomycetaceae bacterium]|nr:MAG: hypothetical protein EHM48_03535 [Planctomycetaceae bacterium]
MVKCSVLIMSLVAFGLLVSPACAAEPTANFLTESMAMSQRSDAASTAPSIGSTTKGAQESQVSEWTKPIPLSFSMSYMLMSDYIWRGINLSEYPHEGREKANNQMYINVEYDLKPFGAVGANFFFEFFEAQPKLTPWSDTHLQEIDYNPYWKYPVAPIDMTFETGWIAYSFPPYSKSGSPDHSLQYTNEWYVKFSFDDSKWFSQPKPVLSPYFALYQDVGLTGGALWAELGVSHAFDLKDSPKLATSPILKNVSITPSAVLGAQHDFYHGLGLVDHDTTKLANINWVLDISYNLSEALNLPPSAGKFTVGPYLGYSQPLDRQALNDEFYGGLKVSFSW